MDVKKDIYIKLDNHVRVAQDDVHLADMASVFCANEDLKCRAENVRVFSFKPEDGEKEVISVLYVYAAVHRSLGEDICLHSIGEADCVVDRISEKKPSEIWQKIQVVIVSLVTFFGAAFSIMAFNEDSGVADIFKTIYEIFSVTEGGKGVLELTYSVGIACGVLLFFNHFEKKGRRNPTAMEIEMDKYEKDMIEAYIKAAERRGKSMEVEE